MTTKIAIIGAGGMLKHHVHGFRKANAEIVGIADSSPIVAQHAAQEYSIPSAFSDLDSMLSNCQADAVSIIVPNKFHHPLTMQCLNAGKHVFCEKPPALNAAQVTEMAAKSAAVRKLLVFNFNNRARPESIALMDMVAAGTIGHINSAQAKWVRRTGIPGFGGWFTTRELSGGGPLIDLLHMIDLALYFMGYPQPAHVLGQTYEDFIHDSSFKGPWGIPDRIDGVIDVESAAHGFVRFLSGQVLSFQVSWAEMVKREEVSVTFQGTKAGGKIERLFGTDGMDLTAEDIFEVYQQVEGVSVNRQVQVESCEDMGRSRSAQNFVWAIEGREPAFNTPDQALILMTIIDAIYQSAETGCPVSCGPR